MGSDGRTPHTLKGTGEEVEKVMEKLAALEYTKKGRQQGAGKLRIGTNMKLSFDLYSMLFVTTIWSEYIDDLKRKKEKRDEAVDRVLNPEKQEKEQE